MVVALIVCLGLQAASGLFANDGASAEGPLASRVALETSNLLTEFHRWNLKVLLVLSGAHIAGVLFHWIVKKENLIGAMFTGVKDVPEGALRERRDALRRSPRRRAASREHASAYFASGWLALGLFVASVVLVALLVRWGH